MPRTPYKTRSGAHVAFTVHLPADLGAWAYQLAEAQDASLSAAVTQVLEDCRTFWDLPKDVAKELAADAKDLGLEQRDYLFYLLRRRFREVRASGPGFDRKGAATALERSRTQK